MKLSFLLSLYLILFLNYSFPSSDSNHDGKIKFDRAKKIHKSSNIEKELSPPPISSHLYPCSDCHNQMGANKKRRRLSDVHSDKSKLFRKKNKHSNHLWCYTCHNENNMNTLRKADGSQIKYNESYKLCGQCHSGKLNDWKQGIHGKRIGKWDGEKTYFLCAHCHNAHNPAFKKLSPMPGPVPPHLIKQ